MRVGSIFSGIEGFGYALEKAGMKVIWQVENAASPIQVLNYRYPDVMRFNDVKEVGRHNLPAVDLICFGWPCQDLSVAGNRQGLAGKRSGLFWEAMRVIEELSPEWFIGENVPGLLSSESGRDMGAVVGRMEELGYGFSWTVLDAQYFHLAQRRERVFFVCSFGDLRSAEILFESDCGPWDSPPRRKKGEGIAGTIGGGSESSRRGWRNDLDTQRAYVIKGAAIGRKPEAGPQFGEVLEDGSCFTMNCTEVHAVCYGGNRQSGEREVHTIDGGNSQCVGLRRMMPIEVERCFGFPDEWTRWGIDQKGRTVEMSDSARYRMLGNSVAVPVVEWIGKRIMEVAGLGERE